MSEFCRPKSETGSVNNLSAESSDYLGQAEVNIAAFIEKARAELASWNQVGCNFLCTGGREYLKLNPATTQLHYFVHPPDGVESISPTRMVFNNPFLSSGQLGIKAFTGAVQVDPITGSLALDLSKTGKIFYNLVLLEMLGDSANDLQEVYQVTERLADGSFDTYQIITPQIEGDSEGILIVCGSGTRRFLKFGERTEAQFISMIKKPIIAFRNFVNDTPLEVEVNYSGRYNLLYPQPDKLESSLSRWFGTVRQDNAFVTKSGKEYPYIFWDGFGHGLNQSNFAKGYCVAQTDLESFLEIMCIQARLDYILTADFVSFWLPVLNTNKYNLIHFLTPSECNQIAALKITSDPDPEIIRFYMAYKGLETKVDNTESLDLAIKPVPWTYLKPTVIEWGGFEID